MVKGKDGTGTAVEVTSKAASKDAQLAKEQRIRDAGGIYVKDPATGKLIPVSYPHCPHTLPKSFWPFFLKFHAQFDVLFSISNPDLTQNHLSHARFCRPAPDFSGLAQPQVRTRACPVIFGEGDSPSITADSSLPSKSHPMPQTKAARSWAFRSCSTLRLAFGRRWLYADGCGCRKTETRSTPVARR